MKVVIDTTVFLSALFSKNGASFKLIRWLFLFEKQANIISVPLITEIEDVLTRTEHRAKYSQLSAEEILGFIDDICSISYHQKIHFLWRPFLSDVKDDMVLETAFNGNADFIIMHNIRDFKRVAKTFSIQIVTPKQFLETIGELT